MYETGGYHEKYRRARDVYRYRTENFRYKSLRNQSWASARAWERSYCHKYSGAGREPSDSIYAPVINVDRVRPRPGRAQISSRNSFVVFFFFIHRESISLSLSNASKWIISFLSNEFFLFAVGKSTHSDIISKWNSTNTTKEPS